MAQKITEELLSELLEATDPQTFIEENDFHDKTLPEYLEELLEAKGKKRVDVIRAADLNETFGYQIFMGTRRASRNKLLQLAFALGLSLEQTNRLLQLGGSNALYCKNKRDAIIIFCVVHECSLREVNEELYRFDEETIY